MQVVASGNQTHYALSFYNMTSQLLTVLTSCDPKKKFIGSVYFRLHRSVPFSKNLYE